MSLKSIILKWKEQTAKCRDFERRIETILFEIESKIDSGCVDKKDCASLAHKIHEAYSIVGEGRDFNRTRPALWNYFCTLKYIREIEQMKGHLDMAGAPKKHSGDTIPDMEDYCSCEGDELQYLRQPIRKNFE
jgi:hypothetical protein